MSTLLAIAALVYLDGPIRWVVFVGLLLFDVFEIWLWLRLRKKRAITGSEAIIGKTGVATTNLDPKGHVRVGGELWTAIASEPISVDQPVTVTGVDGIKLLVSGREGAAAPVNLSR